MNQAVALVERKYIDRQSRGDLWDAWQPILLAELWPEESLSIQFLEQISIMKVPDLQDVVAACDRPGNGEYDDCTVAYELKHEALRRLVRERKAAVN